MAPGFVADGDAGIIDDIDLSSGYRAPAAPRLNLAMMSRFIKSIY
jgi:hypothetical protein